MKNILFFLLIFNFCLDGEIKIIIDEPYGTAFNLCVSNEELKNIAAKIWTNECGKSREDKLKNLIHWNKNEDHASVGIMHFTWHRYAVPEDQFPMLREYIKKESGKSLPEILNGFCPWRSREDFVANINSKEVKILKEYLLDTVILQAKFLIIERFKNVLKKMHEMFAYENLFENVRKHFYRILNLPNGLLIILDTLNMSGEKGLYNTLKQMNGEKSDDYALQEFKKARVNRFDYLVATNPKLKIFYNGWINRINTY
jgi:hypothetical protein